MNIDGGAGTVMYHFGGDLEELAFLRYDITNLAYAIPGLKSGAVIGVGGGRDLLLGPPSRGRKGRGGGNEPDPD